MTPTNVVAPLQNIGPRAMNRLVSLADGITNRLGSVYDDPNTPRDYDDPNEPEDNTEEDETETEQQNDDVLNSTEIENMDQHHVQINDQNEPDEDTNVPPQATENDNELPEQTLDDVNDDVNQLNTSIGVVNNDMQQLRSTVNRISTDHTGYETLVQMVA
jgi:hypothetical protein